jgi:hypothetical protein
MCIICVLKKSYKGSGSKSFEKRSIQKKYYWISPIYTSSASASAARSSGRALSGHVAFLIAFEAGHLPLGRAVPRDVALLLKPI